MSTLPVSDSDRRNYLELIGRSSAIVEGWSYPSRHDRLAGMPPFRDSPLADLQYLAEAEIARGQQPDAVRAALVTMASSPGRWTAAAVRAAILALDGYDQRDLMLALDFNLALLGDAEAINRLLADLVDSGISRVNRANGVALGLGLQGMDDEDERPYRAGFHDTLVRAGHRKLEVIAACFLVFTEVRSAAEAAANIATADDDDIDADVFSLMLEDRAESVVDPGPRSLQPNQQSATDGLVVVPALPSGTGARKDMYRTWAGKAGVALPLVGRGDVGSHRRELVRQWPHAADIIDVILGDLATREAVHFWPTLLVGAPGSGKSSLCRAIGERVGLAVELISLAGASDSSLMGTSAQYHTARETNVLQLIKRTGKANPLMIWDEIEKASPSRHNGSPLDALLPFLEPDQARHYRDPALEVECDLSMVSHFATANSLEGVPAPVRDRMRVLTMPDPGWQHVGVLTTQIVARLAARRGVDPRWFAPLAEDELDLVRAAWPGGSLRQLTRIVTTIVDGRDRIIGRA